MQHLHHYAFESKPTVYDEEALTALELCARTAAKVNECVSTVNEQDEKIKKLFEEDLRLHVYDWLDEHPEATTTVQDKSLEVSKLTDAAYNLLNNGYVTPQMFGAVGDGVADDTQAFEDMLLSGAIGVYIPAGIYQLNKYITIPTHVKNIGGAGLEVTTIHVKNGGFRYAEECAWVAIHDLTVEGTGIETAIAGQFSVASFYNLRLNNLNACVEFGYGTWMVKFNTVYMGNSEYGVKCNESAFNDAKFYHCQFQHLKSAFHAHKTGNMVSFDGCDFEFNEKCFDVGAMRCFKIQNSYIEGNGNILYLVRPYYDGNYHFTNCWLYDTKNVNGWVCMIETTSSADANPASVIIERCQLRGHSNCNAKPVAFVATGTHSLVGVSFLNNWYTCTATTYFDLIDVTNCAGYGKVTNALPIASDLPLFVHSGCKWYGDKRGNHRTAGRGDRHFHAYGCIEGEFTGRSLITIEIHSAASVQPKNEYVGMVTLFYSDGTVTQNRVGFENYNMYIYGVDATKTVNKILVDINYG